MLKKSLVYIFTICIFLFIAEYAMPENEIKLISPDESKIVNTVKSASDIQNNKNESLLHISRGSFDPLNEDVFLSNMRFPNLSYSKGNEEQSQYYIIQFIGVVKEEWKIKLIKAGVVFYDYIPENAFIVKCKNDINIIKADNVFIRAFIPYRPLYKCAQDVLDDYCTSILATNKKNEKTISKSGEIIYKLNLPATKREYFIITFPDIDSKKIGEKIESKGVKILRTSISESKIKYRVEIDSANLYGLAMIPEVKWIERVPEWKLYNEKAGDRDVCNARALWEDRALFGAGQIVGVTDTGLDNGSTDPGQLHDDFENGGGAGRVAQIFDLVGDNPSDNNGHGTHVAGSVCGNGARSGSNSPAHSYPNSSHAGMAPEATLVFQAVMNNSTGGLTGLPDDLNGMFSQTRDVGVKVHNNSWGGDVSGAYTSNSMEVDEFTWANKDYTLLFAAGNSGTDAASPAGVVDEFSLGAPASAKNCITVGASENKRPDTGNSGAWGQLWPNDFPTDPVKSDKISDNINGMAAFSSRGPCLDGRIKPDICAPGSNILSVRSALATNDQHFWANYDQYYGYMGGTSMACPLTCGMCVLLREYLTKNGISNPSSALLKALLLNGATEMYPGQYGAGQTMEIPTAAPNDVEGWGRANPANSLPSGTKQVFLQDVSSGLSTGQEWQYQFSVVNNDQPLRAKLVWTDFPGTLAADGSLINDLNLQIIKPDSTVVKPLNPRKKGYVQHFSYGAALQEAIAPPAVGQSYAVKFTPTKTPFDLKYINFYMYTTTVGTYQFTLKLLDENNGLPSTQIASTQLQFQITDTKSPLYPFKIPVSGFVFNKTFFIEINWNKTNNFYLVISATNPITGNDYYYNGSAWQAYPDDAAKDISMEVIGKGSNAAQGDDDDVNNVEGIEIASPQNGAYTVKVTGANIPNGPQPFAIVLSGNITTGQQTPTPTPSLTPTPFVTPTPVFEVSLSTIINHVLGRISLTPEQINQIDINVDSKVNIADAVRFINAPPTPSPTPSPSPTPTPTQSATPSPSPSPTPAITPSPTATPTGGESDLCFAMFNEGPDLANVGTSAVNLVSQAVWKASELNGWNLTLFGTITQSAPNSEIWTYLPTPTDKLIAVVSGGPIIEFAFSVFNGYISGTWEDFADYHSLDFTCFINGVINIRVQSYIVPFEKENKGITQRQWSRETSGIIVYNSENVNVDIIHTGTKKLEVDSGWASLDTTNQFTGTATSATKSFNFSQAYWYLYSYYNGTHVINQSKTNNTSAVYNGNTYSFQNAFVRWESVSQFAVYQPDYELKTISQIVNQPDYWILQGGMLKNNVAFGTCAFDIPVILGSHGPELILQTPSGNYFLHTLIAYP